MRPPPWQTGEVPGATRSETPSSPLPRLASASRPPLPSERRQRRSLTQAERKGREGVLDPVSTEIAASAVVRKSPWAEIHTRTYSTAGDDRIAS